MFPSTMCEWHFIWKIRSKGFDFYQLFASLKTDLVGKFMKNWLMPLVSYALIMSCRKPCKCTTFAIWQPSKCLWVEKVAFTKKKKQKIFRSLWIRIETNVFCLKLCVNFFRLSLLFLLLSVINTWLSRFKAAQVWVSCDHHHMLPSFDTNNFSTFLLHISWYELSSSKYMGRWNFMCVVTYTDRCHKDVYRIWCSGGYSICNQIEKLRKFVKIFQLAL